MENLPSKKHTQNFLKISDAIQHPYKIKDAIDDELKIEISFAMNLMGVPLDRLPNQMQRNVLFQFIRDNYPFYSVAEIRTAFTMAAKGDLQCDCNHYGSFSAEYFGRIMKAYSENRSKEVIKIGNSNFVEEKPYIPTDEEKRKIQREFDETVVLPIWQNYLKTDRVEIGYVPMKLIYDSVCVFHALLTLSKEQKDKIYQEAKESVLNQKKMMSESKSSSRQEQKEKMEIRQALESGSAFGSEIQSECYRKCVFLAFEKLRNEGKSFSEFL
jgi:hypothetical protein